MRATFPMSRRRWWPRSPKRNWALDQVTPTDPAAARLRTECVQAKEALSHDMDVTIPVLLPGHHGEVRLTREEFENAIRPALGDSVAALRRALDSAGVAAEDLRAVLLVGGSSRISLVADVVSNELGRPVAVDAHPKHVVALGAAAAAHDAAQGSVAAAAPESASVAGSTVVDAPSATVPAPSGTRPVILLVAILIIAAGAAAAFFVFARDSGDTQTADPVSEEEDGDGSDGESDGDQSATTTTTETPTTSTTTTTTSTTTTTTTIPDLPDPECNGGLCIEIDDLSLVDGNLEIAWTPEGFEPALSGTHAHFFWDIYDVAKVGSNAAERDPWELTAERVFVPTGEMRLSNKPADATGVCVTVATSSHGVADPANFHCVPLPEA